MGSVQCIRSALRSLFYYLSPFSFWKEGGKISSEYIYIYREFWRRRWLNTEVSLINTSIYHCLQDPGAEFKFNVFGKDSASVLATHAAKASIFQWQVLSGGISHLHILTEEWKGITRAAQLGQPQQEDNVWAWLEIRSLFHFFLTDLTWKEDKSNGVSYSCPVTLES